MQQLAFKCQRCGRCCEGEGGIVLSDKDLNRLATHMQISVQELKLIYCKSNLGKTVLKSNKKNYCIFFDSEQGCTIHKVKPDICRAWPFFKGNLLDELSWKMAQEFCPGINPKISHSEFVIQGTRYLYEMNLICRTENQAQSLVLQEELVNLFF